MFPASQCCCFPWPCPLVCPPVPFVNVRDDGGGATTDNVEEAVDAIERDNLDLVVAVGGGSVLDCGKVGLIPPLDETFSRVNRV